MKTGYDRNTHITVYYNDERFKYSIHEILSAFFDPDNILYFDINNEEKSMGKLCLKITVSEYESDYEYIFSLYENEVSVYDENFIMSEIYDMKEKENNTLLNRGRKSLKTVLYKFLCGLTGQALPWGSMTGIRPVKVVNQMFKWGMDEAGIHKELTEKYFMNKGKADLALNVAAVQRDMVASNTNKSISLYIGIPFCPTRCLYCSFTSNPVNKYLIVTDEYVDILIYEMQSTKKFLEDSLCTVESIYIGGGTPTALNNEQLERLLVSVREIWGGYFSELKEFCVEAGRPDSINDEKLSTMKKNNVTRISINPQSINNGTLERIGRKHSSEDFFNAFYKAREHGFENINVDIIAGLPGEDFEMFKETADKVVLLSPENITVHTMSIKRASELKKYKYDYIMTSDEETDRMISYAYEAVKTAGMKPFYMYRQKNMLGNLENVSYSKPGFESYYNIHIMEEDQTILAFGAGGVSKFVKEDIIERVFNVKSVEDYIKRKEEMIDRKKKFVYNYLVK